MEELKFTVKQLKALADSFETDINPENLEYPDVDNSQYAFIEYIEECIKKGTAEYIIFNSEDEE